jgi:hypothetical protein
MDLEEFATRGAAAQTAVNELGAGPHPHFDLRAHLERQREWSAHTFGPGTRTEGISDHIRKELAEIADKPHDLSEWIDVVLLALDGAWRAGYTAAEICAALAQKQRKNELRKWPDWRTAELGKAIEHDRSADGAKPEGES